MQEEIYEIIYHTGSRNNLCHKIRPQDLSKEFLTKLSPCGLEPIALFDKTTKLTRDLENISTSENNENFLNPGRYYIVYKTMFSCHKKQSDSAVSNGDQFKGYLESLLSLLGKPANYNFESRGSSENNISQEIVCEPEPKKDVSEINRPKLLVVGDIGCGKTSLLNRRIHDTFNIAYKSTIGADFSVYSIGSDHRFQCWDISGQERYGNMTRTYYKDVAIAIIAFDVSRASTFEGCVKWKNDIDNKITLSNGDKIPCILVACKSDLTPDLPIDDESMNRYCREKGFVNWCRISSSKNTGFDVLDDLLLKYTPK